MLAAASAKGLTLPRSSMAALSDAIPLPSILVDPIVELARKPAGVQRARFLHQHGVRPAISGIPSNGRRTPQSFPDKDPIWTTLCFDTKTIISDSRLPPSVCSFSEKNLGKLADVLAFFAVAEINSRHAQAQGRLNLRTLRAPLGEVVPELDGCE